VARSAGGIGQIIEFRADGSMTHWFAAMVELTYVIQGPRVTTSFRPPQGGPVEEATTEVRYEGDVLIQKGTQSDAEIRMTRKRAGGPGDPPIVGVWTYPHEAGGTAFMMYTPDGRLIFRLPIRADRGRWSASGDQLTLGATTTARVTYRVRNGQLELTDARGKQMTYTRAEIVEFQ